jgi:hemoglobin
VKTHYDMLGGEAALWRIVGSFYDLMDETPDFRAFRKLHPADFMRNTAD